MQKQNLLLLAIISFTLTSCETFKKTEPAKLVVECCQHKSLQAEIADRDETIERLELTIKEFKLKHDYCESRLLDSQRRTERLRDDLMDLTLKNKNTTLNK